MSAFNEVKKNFGFGLMRLPKKDGAIDNAELCEMVDYFIEHGFNYFDTAHGYHNGLSEVAVRECLTSRYPRDAYVLTNKLSSSYFKTQEEIRPYFEKQLEICGVDYFDFYLMHAQDKKLFERYKKCNAYETALEFLAEGKIKHFGISFHDKAEVLEEILTEYPQIEVVQIQFNYVDYDDASVQGRKVYEVCRKFNKPIIIMEPVKGGSLVNLPEAANDVLSALNGGSNASYAIRFAASFEGVFMVLSGMGNMDMVRDNLSYMESFKPLNDEEFEAVWRVRDIFNSQKLIPCTECRYCMEVCPKQIPIPNFFACLNDKKRFNNWNSSYYYSIHSKNIKPSDCIKCGKCEVICPQHLKIRELLCEVESEFVKEEDGE